MRSSEWALIQVSLKEDKPHEDRGRARKMLPQALEHWDYQKLEEARKDQILEDMASTH